MNRVYRLTLFVLGGLVLMGGLLTWHLQVIEQRTEVVFLNVGQGDAILITQGKYQVLIDGGRTSKELLARIGRHMPFWDRKIEVVMATHPDADHIGGLPALLRSYRVDEVLTTGATSETETSRQFQEAVRDNTGQDPERIFRGGSITFPKGGELAVLYPLAPVAGTSVGDTNEGSIVTRFTYGETSFLLTGDLPAEERALPDTSPATVLKVAHHGSKHSSSEAFLRLVQPKEAILSVGKNSYGHPDPLVMDRLRSIGAQIHRTDQDGDIRYRCFSERCVFVP
ncbi:MAG: MBL fold metallo-hydrolase [Candidatus Moranbacteria bacterium]|nr:MBL fold metallo-hydrolase [Candidatus Moranbacteria bacterium]